MSKANNSFKFQTCRTYIPDLTAMHNYYYTQWKKPCFCCRKKLSIEEEVTGMPSRVIQNTLLSIFSNRAELVDDTSGHEKLNVTIAEVLAIFFLQSSFSFNSSSWERNDGFTVRPDITISLHGDAVSC